MRIYSIVVAMTLCVMIAVPFARAADMGDAQGTSAKAANTPNSQERLDRAAQLKAKIEAAKHPQEEAEKPVPLYRKSVRGSEQIKEKMKLSQDDGKRGNQKLASYVHALLGKGTPANKRLSFKERLKREQAKERARKERLEKK